MLVCQDQPPHSLYPPPLSHRIMKKRKEKKKRDRLERRERERERDQKEREKNDRRERELARNEHDRYPHKAATAAGYGGQPSGISPTTGLPIHSTTTYLLSPNGGPTYHNLPPSMALPPPLPSPPPPPTTIVTTIQPLRICRPEYLEKYPGGAAESCLCPWPPSLPGLGRDPAQRRVFWAVRKDSQGTSLPSLLFLPASLSSFLTNFCFIPHPHPPPLPPSLFRWP